MLHGVVAARLGNRVRAEQYSSPVRDAWSESVCGVLEKVSSLALLRCNCLAVTMMCAGVHYRQAPIFTRLREMSVRGSAPSFRRAPANAARVDVSVISKPRALASRGGRVACDLLQMPYEAICPGSYRTPFANRAPFISFTSTIHTESSRSPRT
jgi:hypothetical protein